MHFSSGANYNGEWVDGERHGHGVLAYANGAEYQVCMKKKKPSQYQVCVCLKNKGEWVLGELYIYIYIYIYGEWV